MFAFKGLLVLSLFAYACSSPISDEDAKKEMHANADICKEEFHIEGPIQDIFRSDDEQPENAKCFLKCVFEKNGVIVDGKINREKLIHAITIHSNEENAIKIADACIDDTEMSTCDDIAKFHICTVKISKENCSKNEHEHDHDHNHDHDHDHEHDHEHKH